MAPRQLFACPSLSRTSFHFLNQLYIPSKMATDLRKAFFGAIDTSNMKQISRLLFATPNLAAGLSRLSAWKITSDEWSTSFTSKLPNSSLIPKGYAQELDALSVSLFLIMSDSDLNPLKREVARLIISVCLLTSQLSDTQDYAC